MRELYKPWYLNTGIVRATNFLAPPVLDGNTFFLPKNSLLHFNTFSETLTGPTDKDYIFSVEKKVVVSNVLKYSGTPIGNFRIASGFSNASVIRELKANRGSNTIKYPEKPEKVEDTSLFVINYNSLLPAYKYTNSSIVLYSKWLNTMETIVENVNQNLDATLRQQFILIEIPNSIPTKEILKEKSTKDISKQILDVFNTYKLLTLLDMWKYLSYKLHNDSVMSKLNNKKLDKVNLLFKFKNKYTVLNMATLFHLANLYPTIDNEVLNTSDDDTEIKTKANKKNAIEDYDVKIDKRNPLQARGAMLLLLRKIISNGAVTYTEALNSTGTIIDTNNLKLSTGAYNNTLLNISNSDTDDFNFEDEEIQKLGDDFSIPTVETMPDVVITENEMVDIKEDDIDFDPIEEEDFVQALKEEEFTSVSEEVELEKEETLEELFIESKDRLKNQNLNKIKKAIDNGEVSKNLGEQLTNIVENQDYLPSPYGDENKYLGNYLNIDPEDAKLDEKDLIIPAIDISVNPKGLTIEEIADLTSYLKELDVYNKDVLNVLDKTYVKKLHKKFLVASVYKMQDAGLIISDYTVREDKDSLGAFEVHTIETTTLKGKKNKNWIKLPALDATGKYKMSGIDYRLRKQAGDSNFDFISSYLNIKVKSK